MQMNMLEAKTKLSQLVEAAEHGEEVLIARNGVPVAQIVPIRKRKFNYGFLKGKIRPVSDTLLFAMSDEAADRFVDGKD
jgi:prevent-host-death family protein